MPIPFRVKLDDYSYYGSRIHTQPVPESPAYWVRGPVASSCSAMGEALLEKILNSRKQRGATLKFGKFIAATSAPDRLSPSLAQTLQTRFPEELARTPSLDLVQGCAGSVSGLCLAAEWAQAYQKPVLFLAVDAASRATSPWSELNSGFGDGAFACVVEPQAPGIALGLTKHCVTQFGDVRDVVLVGLGHHTRSLVQEDKLQAKFGAQTSIPRSLVESWARDLEDGLGLAFNRKLAMRLVEHARAFVQEFFEGVEKPDRVVLHQVNPRILDEVERRVFPAAEGYRGFENQAAEVGNCGAASVGLVFGRVWRPGERVFLCSFGTGGVISGSLWQF